MLHSFLSGLFFSGKIIPPIITSTTAFVRLTAKSLSAVKISLNLFLHYRLFRKWNNNYKANADAHVTSSRTFWKKGTLLIYQFHNKGKSHEVVLPEKARTSTTISAFLDCVYVVTMAQPVQELSSYKTPWIMPEPQCKGNQQNKTKTSENLCK